MASSLAIEHIIINGFALGLDCPKFLLVKWLMALMAFVEQPSKHDTELLPFTVLKIEFRFISFILAILSCRPSIQFVFICYFQSFF